MAQCKVTPQEFIQNAFSPSISVICSPLVDTACRKNNLSFVELLQPFCRLNVEAQIRDPTGNAITVRNLRMNLLNVNSRPPQPGLARKYLNSSVMVTSDIRMTTIPINDYNLEVPAAYPWFDMWRETFLQVQYPSEHEFTKHFLACIVVVSSSEPNPLESVNAMLQNITKLQNTKSESGTGHSKFPKWFSTNILKYFVVLHDTIEGNGEIAIQTVESLKQTYGSSNCFLLQINSRAAGTTDDQFLPDPWTQFLVRKTECMEISENPSPPRTPADSSDVNVTLMPTVSVTCDPDPDPDVSDTEIDATTNAASSPIMTTNHKLEIGQEANETVSSVPVSFHPLSPDVEVRMVTTSNTDDESESASVTINTNVWQDKDTSSPTVVHGACLTTEDIEQLKLLVNEFYLKSLLPYVEKQIQRLSDVISNKKGVSRSLFSATKRWFTPSKLGGGVGSGSGSGSTTAVSSLVYADESPELQVRRLADLYFMFGHYSMAFQVYHSAKRDFNADCAWLYYAGALEMAALSAFMCGEVTRKTCDYMEESIVTYLYTCRLPQFATRVTLLSTECLKGKGQFGEAAHQLIRMTSEDSDLRSALLLEQAAYCFLNCHKPRMVRKYAFHIILAGHRFSKCLQRKHSLRCYRQAFQVYCNKEWSLAEDHIYFTIGRQASNLKQLEEAKDAFSKLLTPKSKQNAQQQAIFLKEYLNIYTLIWKESGKQTFLPELRMPILNSNETKVLLGGQVPVSIPGRVPASSVSFTSDENSEMNEKWTKLEQIMVQEAGGIGSSNSQQMMFKPMVTLFSNQNSHLVNPVGVMGEPIQLLISLTNTLQISLPFKDIYLLWKFTTKDNENITNEFPETDESNSCEYIKTDKISVLNISPDSTDKLILTLTPLAVGELVITGICYTIINIQTQEGITGKQDFNIRGPKLNLKEKDQAVYGQDKRLNITITPPAPCLQVGFSEINQELLCNELQHITIELRNCGITPLHKIIMSSSVPHLFSLSNTSNTNTNHVIPIKLPVHFNNRLEPGQSHIMNLCLRAPDTKGTALVNLLFYYENINPQSIPRYRLVRHLWHFSVQDSLDTEMKVQHSRDCNQVETLTLSLRATNSNQIHHAVVSEITLLQASLMSQHWKFSQDAIIPKALELQLQGQIFVLQQYQRVRILVEDLYILYYMVAANTCTLYTTLLFLLVEAMHKIEVERFMLAYRSPNENKSMQYSDLKLSLNTNTNTEIKKEGNMLCFENCSNNVDVDVEAMLILGWRAFVTDSAGNKRQVVGQHYIPVVLENIAESVNVHQVTYSVAHPPVLTHDFINNKVCIVPVRLILYSSANMDLIVKINTRGTSSDSTLNKYKNELFNPNSSNYFRWMGHSELICHLKSFSSCQLGLNIAVVSPGTYDLGERIDVSCKHVSHAQDSILQTCRVQNALIIKCVSEK